MHLGSEFFAAIDLSNFFGTVGRSKIVRSLKRLGFTYKEAGEIASASTVRDGGRAFVPYGFVQSPLLASIALAESYLGRQLAGLRRKGVKVSLYVDDLVLSHVDDEATLSEAVDTLVEAATISGFLVNGAKLQRPSRTVVAFNIRLSHGRLELMPDRLLDFRQRLAGSGPDASAMATISYVDMIDVRQGDILRAEVGLAPVSP